MSAIFDNASQVTQSNKLSVMSATVQSGRRVSQRRGAFLYQFEVSVNPLHTDSTAYKAIRAEISSIDYGVDPLTTTISYLTEDSGSWLGTPVIAGTSALTGTIDPTASTTVVGVGTLFLTELTIGDSILVTGETRVITAIASNTSLTVSVAFTDVANDATPDRIPANTGRYITLTGFTANETDVIVDGDFIQFANNAKVYQAVGNKSSDANGSCIVYLNTPVITSPAGASAVTHGTSVIFSLAIDESAFPVSFTPRNSSNNISRFNPFSFTEVVI